MDGTLPGEPPAARPRAPLPPVPWGPFEALGVFLVALVLGGILAVGAFALGTCAAQQAVAALAGEVALAAVVIGWVRVVHRTSPRTLGLRVPRPADVFIGLAGGGALLIAGWAVLALVTVVSAAILGHTPAQPDQVDRCVTGAWLYGLGPIVVLAAPLAEELFFRGFLYRGLRRRWAVWPSALLSGGLFGLAHLQGESFLLIVPPLIVVGVGLALIFEYRQTLLASMSAHALFNLVGFVTIAWARR
jgi:membrane protease YdiL (CAAX protease family)